jgi:protocatechuate 3,4-dioxygenase beta subunit
MAITRRAVLTAGLPWLVGMTPFARSAAQGLDQFVMAGPPCNDAAKPTPGIAKDATFKAGSPERTSLIQAATTGTRLTLTGTVSGVTCGRIKGARVDFWQADATGAYDMTGFRFRGHQQTDAMGAYRLTTIIPGNAGGRARHIGVNVVVSGKADFWTEIFFPDDPLRAKDPRFRAELLAKLAADPRLPGATTATFDIVLDI